MSSVIEFIKNLPADNHNSDEVTTEIKYIRKSSALVNDALQRGFDVMQMPNGDIMITEVKTITYKYEWNTGKGKFERASTGNRQQKKRRKASGVELPESADNDPLKECA